MLEPSKFVGRAPEQVKDFVLEHVEPVLKKYDSVIDKAKVDSVSV
jgi:adenylosuccinate lyase